MTTKKEYCLVIEDNNTDSNQEITKNFIEELLEIVKYLDFEKVSGIKIFRSDNL